MKSKGEIDLGPSTKKLIEALEDAIANPWKGRLFGSASNPEKVITEGSVPRMPQDGEGYRQVIAAELPKGPKAVISTGGFDEGQVVEMEDTCQLIEVHVEQAAMLLKTLALKLSGLKREIRRRKGEGNDNPFSPLGEEEL